MKTCALIVAAGSSQRCPGAVPKQFREVAGRPLLAWTVSRFEAAAAVDDIVVVVAEEHLLYVAEKVLPQDRFPKVSKVVPGGTTRQQSVLRGLERVSPSTNLVVIHDGARPLIAPADIKAVIDVAGKSRAALLAAKATDTVKRVEQGYVFATLDRSNIYHAQTPQAFQYDLILEAHRRAASEGLAVSDDAALIEGSGFAVTVVEPTGPNWKITTEQDLRLAATILREENDG